MSKKDTALTVANGNQLAEILTSAPVKYSEEDFESVSSAGFLPRLQLITSNSDVAKSGEFPINHYAIVDNSVHTDLGKDVNIFVLTWRPKALDLTDKSNIVCSYDPKSDLFQSIIERSKVKNSTCMYGPEYLIYIPSVAKFATLLMGGPTTRKESPKLQAKLKDTVTLTSKLVDTGQYKYSSISVTPCSTTLDLPDLEKLKQVMEDFNNPKEIELEKATTNSDSDRVR